MADEANSPVAAMKPAGGLDSSKSLDRLRTLYDILEATDGRLGRSWSAGEGDSGPGVVAAAWFGLSDSAMVLTVPVPGTQFRMVLIV